MVFIMLRTLKHGLTFVDELRYFSRTTEEVYFILYICMYILISTYIGLSGVHCIDGRKFTACEEIIRLQTINIYLVICISI